MPRGQELALALGAPLPRPPPPCALYSQQSDNVFLHVLLFEHAQLPALPPREAPVPGKFASDDFLGHSEPRVTSTDAPGW